MSALLAEVGKGERERAVGHTNSRMSLPLICHPVPRNPIKDTATSSVDAQTKCVYAAGCVVLGAGLAV